MFKLKILALLLISIFLLSGCVTLSKSKNGKKKTRFVPSPPPCARRVLVGDGGYYLQSWLYAAKLAEDVNDLETAINYYRKIKEYFPDTKEGLRAEQKLKFLRHGLRQ